MHSIVLLIKRVNKNKNYGSRTISLLLSKFKNTRFHVCCSFAWKTTNYQNPKHQFPSFDRPKICNLNRKHHVQLQSLTKLSNLQRNYQKKVIIIAIHVMECFMFLFCTLFISFVNLTKIIKETMFLNKIMDLFLSNANSNCDSIVPFFMPRQILSMKTNFFQCWKFLEKLCLSPIKIFNTLASALNQCFHLNHSIYIIFKCQRYNVKCGKMSQQSSLENVRPSIGFSTS